jgi:hypothetical protein
MILIMMSIESDFLPQMRRINKYRCEFPVK